MLRMQPFTRMFGESGSGLRYTSLRGDCSNTGDSDPEASVSPTHRPRIIIQHKNRKFAFISHKAYALTALQASRFHLPHLVNIMMTESLFYGMYENFGCM